MSKTFFLATLLVISFSTQAMTWNWEDGAGNSGTFTTSGILSGGTAAAGNYVVTDFSVLTSANGQTIGSVSGNQYSMTGVLNTYGPFSFDWNGTDITNWYNDPMSPNMDHHFVAFKDLLSPTPIKPMYGFGKTGNAHNFYTYYSTSPTTGNFRNSTYTMEPVGVSVPEPSLISLIIIGSASIGFVRRRKTQS